MKKELSFGKNKNWKIAITLDNKNLTIFLGKKTYIVYGYPFYTVVIGKNRFFAMSGNFRTNKVKSFSKSW